MYETCITAFQEIRARSATNLAGGYHAGMTVSMAVISEESRTTGALHPGPLDVDASLQQGEEAGAGIVMIPDQGTR